jgi:cytochrome b559 alpha subunit
LYLIQPVIGPAAVFMICYWLVKSKFHIIGLLTILYFVILSTGERPFIDILQDRRYWVIHLITIPSLFLAGVIFIDSPFVYKLFGRGSFNQYFYKQCSTSGLNEISDINI